MTSERDLKIRLLQICGGRVNEAMEAYRWLKPEPVVGEDSSSHSQGNPSDEAPVYPHHEDKAEQQDMTRPYCSACLSAFGDDGLCPCCDHNYKVWNGGECPVDPDAFVDILLRSGGGESGPAGEMDWAHSIFHTHPNDIVYYRLQSSRPKYDGDGMLIKRNPEASGEAAVTPRYDLIDYHALGRAAYVDGAHIDDLPVECHPNSLAASQFQNGWLQARGPNKYPDGTPRFDWTLRDTSQDGEARSSESGTGEGEAGSDGLRMANIIQDPSHD